MRELRATEGCGSWAGVGSPDRRGVDLSPRPLPKPQAKVFGMYVLGQHTAPISPRVALGEGTFVAGGPQDRCEDGTRAGLQSLSWISSPPEGGSPGDLLPPSEHGELRLDQRASEAGSHRNSTETTGAGLSQEGEAGSDRFTACCASQSEGIVALLALPVAVDLIEMGGRR